MVFFASGADGSSIQYCAKVPTESSSFFWKSKTDPSAKVLRNYYTSFGCRRNQFFLGDWISISIDGIFWKNLRFCDNPTKYWYHSPRNFWDRQLVVIFFTNPLEDVKLSQFKSLQIRLKDFFLSVILKIFSLFNFGDLQISYARQPKLSSYKRPWEKRIYEQGCLN